MSRILPGVLLDRERELAELEAALDEALAARGRALLVSGEAGIGKTALLEEAAERARARDMLVLWATGGTLESDFAFGVARQLFEPVAAPRLLTGAAVAAAPALGLRAASSSVFGAGQRALSLELEHGLYWLAANLAEQRPLLVAVDDVQWADRDSLRVLVYLGRRLEELPLVLLVSLRDGPGDQAGEELLALTGLPRLGRITPAPLSDSGAAALIEHRLGATPEPAFLRACLEASGGNPFLLGALLDELAGEGVAPVAAEVGHVRQASPATVQHSVLVRLARLGPAAVALAQAVAILGRDAALATAAGVAALDPEDVRAAADALIKACVLARDVPLRFAHPLLGAAVYADIGLVRRADGHRRAAELLEASTPERAAGHLLALPPGDDPWVLERLLAAAERALARGSAGAARTLLERALAEAGGDRERAELLVALAELESREGGAGATQRLQGAVAMAHEPSLRLRALRALVVEHWLRGELDEALRLLDEALHNEPDEELEADRAGVLALARPASTAPGGLTRRPPRELERLGGETPAERRLLAALAFHRLIWGETTGADVGRLAERALAGGRLVADAGAGQPSVLAALSVLQNVDRDDDVAAELEAALDAADARGAVAEAALLRTMQARLAFFRGDLRSAEAEARDALHITSAAGFENGRRFALTSLVAVLVERGELGAAEAALEAAGVAEGIPPASGPRWLLLQARVALRQAQGRLEEAAADARRAVAERTGPAGAILPGACMAALALQAAGHTGEADRLAAAGLAHARGWGVPSTLGAALRIQGLVTGGEEGLAALEESAEVLSDSARQLEYARTLVELGAARRRANRRAAAREPLAAGMELAHQCGADALVGRARNELVACGARPRRPVRTGVEALTPSELRVAQLAAAGHSNRTIAQLLFVSPKTVQTHLGAIYRKLGVNDRSRLADRLEPSGKVQDPPPDAKRCNTGQAARR